jgi:hypothetical protein
MNFFFIFEIHFDIQDILVKTIQHIKVKILLYHHIIKKF